MQLSIDLTGRDVLVTGSEQAARQAVRRYEAAGAAVYRLTVPNGGEHDGPLPERPFLVAAVDDGQPGWEALLERCRSAGIPVSVEPAAGAAGHVTLVGGGPGTADLLTVAAVDALRDADVVFYDRLAPYQALPTLTTAELIDVGKRPGHHKVGQADIEKLMVESALAGNNVVRLKGGDPYVFGRGGEEVAACVAAGVKVRVISGVTSAISVPAAAGIPVTHREVSHMFTVVSGHAPLSKDELHHLAGLGGTIVVLMGIGTLHQLAAGLRKAGMRDDMPMAVVERGYRPGQRTTIANLGTITSAAAACSNPAVLVIGEVVRVAEANRSHAETSADLDRLAASLLGA
ncbi:uroporphyrinogen-III C-methyltransferase [Pseudarthrobacter sp. J75]|uniref:uroporphyrinogen-III C-methyltransferase n=1 Tax=unclassified Pseudarthrobacter TaxID=2647000 RepID=UPI002E82195F|nr:MULTISPECIES: uroporphyrinogen-III C-methyltransferase [unclassified Pseudarthrobacter]MEE2521673.1 uroporphyrinogen-III C-methyltransferase [Pseudarthrobacter sp. J47]MEE2527750.1 uroporphyrinogen-III C-methyltransferase [Pseudarthrobacter sp. J75]MEE2569318.1 uroporphyrinogen-III C-methyltransferase [Pseudarthrobacter sp. J64]